MIKIPGISSISSGKVKPMDQEQHDEHHLSDIQGWLSPSQSHSISTISITIYIQYQKLIKKKMNLLPISLKFTITICVLLFLCDIAK